MQKFNLLCPHDCYISRSRHTSSNDFVKWSYTHTLPRTIKPTLPLAPSYSHLPMNHLSVTNTVGGMTIRYRSHRVFLSRMSHITHWDAYSVHRIHAHAQGALMRAIRNWFLLLFLCIIAKKPPIVEMLTALIRFNPHIPESIRGYTILWYSVDVYVWQSISLLYDFLLFHNIFRSS